MESSGSVERRMARYKEERRRQLASHVANRLSAASKTKDDRSSSSDDEDTKNPSKPRRFKDHGTGEPVPPRRRRRRSFTNGSSPSGHRRRSPSSRSGSKSRKPSEAAHDADGEYDENDENPRETSPDHIYHQIGTNSLLKMAKASPRRARVVVAGAGDRYSSEELLFQAASSLQGLEDEFKVQRHQRSSLGSANNALSSPDIIRSVSKNLKASPSPKRLNLNVQAAKSNSESPPSGKPPICPVSPEGGGSMPPFMREFVARRSNRMQGPLESFNPNEPAPPASFRGRPQSAFIPRGSSVNCGNLEEKEQQIHNSRRLKFESRDSVRISRRKSDFVQRYENLMSRAQEAMKKLDGEGERTGVQVADVTDDDEDVPDVDFNEEEVLRRCRDFILDYDESKRNRKAPVPKPRQFIPNLRTRSSSLTIHDKSREYPDPEESHPEVPPIPLPKPILKKSSEDLMRVDVDSLVPILKHQSEDQDVGVSSILKQRDHVRIRSPSPDLDDHHPKPILRSRTNSVGGHSGDESPEVSFKSILKRRSSAEDLEVVSSGATSRSSPEPPQGILKHFGSGGTSSPAELIANTLTNSGGSSSISGALLCSILKKRTTSSQHSSHAGSLEDLTSAASSDGVKSILKKSSFPVSTDDEVDVEVGSGRKPRRSILKSRRSEESLSPLSDPNGGSAADQKEKDGGSTTPVDFIEVGHESSSPAIKPILKSRSPTRGSVSPLDGSSGFSSSFNPGSRSSPASATTPPVSTTQSPSARRSSLSFSPIKRGPEVDDERKTSFVSQTFIELSPRKASCPETLEILPILKRSSSVKDDDEWEDVPRPPSSGSRKRSILRKDSSYDETLKPILKNTGEILDTYDPSVVAEAKVLSPSSSKADLKEPEESSDDQTPRTFSDVIIDKPITTASVLDASSGSEVELENIFKKVNVSGVVRNLETSESNESEVEPGTNSAFNDVIIDPIPNAVKPSLPSSRKNSGSFNSSRQPVIPPSSVKISADGNLADKLEVLAGQAEAIKMRMMSSNQSPLSALPPSGASSGTPTVQPTPSNPKASTSAAVSFTKRCLRRFPPQSSSVQQSDRVPRMGLPWARKS